MPWTPMSESASRTSSSLKGFITAATIFISAQTPVAGGKRPFLPCGYSLTPRRRRASTVLYTDNISHNAAAGAADDARSQVAGRSGPQARRRRAAGVQGPEDGPGAQLPRHVADGARQARPRHPRGIRRAGGRAVPYPHQARGAFAAPRGTGDRARGPGTGTREQALALGFHRRGGGMLAKIYSRAQAGVDAPAVTVE